MKHLIESHFRDGTTYVPSVGDYVRPVNGSDVSLFCGSFKARWILATENTSFLSSNRWDIRVVEPFKAYRAGIGSRNDSRRLYEAATHKPLLGSRVSSHGLSGLYIRSDGNLGLQHQLAVLVTEENRAEVVSRDFDRFVKHEGRIYGILFVISEAMNLVSFPDPEDVELAMKVANSPAALLRHP